MSELLDHLHIMMTQFRACQRLADEHPLRVALPTRLYDELVEQDRIKDDGDGRGQYVVVYERKIGVEPPIGGRDIMMGFIDGLREGSRPKAPHTGPRRPSFAKRGRA